MKHIRIGIENNVINLYDENSDPIDEYITKLSETLQASNMVILDVTSGSAIIRPSKINSIHVEQVGEILPQEESSEPQLTLPEEEEKTEEDMITDGD